MRLKSKKTRATKLQRQVLKAEAAAVQEQLAPSDVSVVSETPLQVVETQQGQQREITLRSLVLERVAQLRDPLDKLAQEFYAEQAGQIAEGSWAVLCPEELSLRVAACFLQHPLVFVAKQPVPFAHPHLSLFSTFARSAGDFLKNSALQGDAARFNYRPAEFVAALLKTHRSELPLTVCSPELFLKLFNAKAGGEHVVLDPAALDAPFGFAFESKLANAKKPRASVARKFTTDDLRALQGPKAAIVTAQPLYRGLFKQFEFQRDLECLVATRLPSRAALAFCASCGADVHLFYSEQNRRADLLDALDECLDASPHSRFSRFCEFAQSAADPQLVPERIQVVPDKVNFTRSTSLPWAETQRLEAMGVKWFVPANVRWVFAGERQMTRKQLVTEYLEHFVQRPLKALGVEAARAQLTAEQIQQVRELVSLQELRTFVEANGVGVLEALEHFDEALG